MPEGYHKHVYGISHTDTNKTSSQSRQTECPLTSTPVPPIRRASLPAARTASPPRVERVYVVGLGGDRADGVLGQAEDGVQVLREARLDGRQEGAEDGRRAAQVALHSRHGGLGLHGEAARVVDDALADPSDAVRGAGRRVTEHGQRRRVHGRLAWPHREDAR